MHDPIVHGMNPELLAYICPKILISTLIGFMIGYFRESQGKPSGIKTHVLLCVGTTLFTASGFLIASSFPNTDVSRIIGQIVTGIGFLGAGNIYKSQDKVNGLTSAAFVWFVAALGVLCGLGGYALSLGLTVFFIIFTSIVSRFERKHFHTGRDIRNDSISK